MVEIINRSISYSESECIYLDLKVVSILGFERKKSGHRIESIIKGIKDQDEFPPVFLVPVGELKYRLTRLEDYCNMTNCGGHYRALAHYFENKPLRSLILNHEFVKLYDYVAIWCLHSDADQSGLFPIEEIIIR